MSFHAEMMISRKATDQLHIENFIKEDIRK
jgi:hypothetical protein